MPENYLLIENNGVAPIEGYTVLGLSTTRDDDTPGTIGQFGSGSKHAINVCLRNNLKVWVYCGKTRLEFGTEYEEVNDGLTTKEVWYVVYRKGNNDWKRTGWVLDFGVLDWCDTGMALRELISNAIDRTLREPGGFAENHLGIKTVTEKERRAKDGTTRVYVELNEDVREYFGKLGKHFLHFSDNPKTAKPGVYSKSGRCPTGGEGAAIYREGVYVRTLEGTSLYDYNFSTDELKIDECRNSSDYHVKAAIARKLGNADAATLASIFRAGMRGEQTIETELDQDYVFGHYGSTPTETQKETWTRAWDAAAGSDTVLCDDEFSRQYVAKKGHKPRIIPNKWARSLKKIGVKKADDILNADEKAGRTILDATPDAQAAIDWAWELFEVTELVGGKEKPPVHCFQEITKAGASNSGFYKDGECFIHIDIANDGQNKELKKTALEEVAHYITGATDNSVDFQNFFIDFIALAF